MSGGGSAQIAPQFTAQNAAILSRIKDLLNQQRQLLRDYLTALEKQQTAIESGGGEEILAYIEIEERIIAGIFSIQKVIDPLESAVGQVIDDISALKSELEVLKNRAMGQSEHNKRLLSARMEDIGAEIGALRNNPLAIAARRSLYHSAGAASLIDIEG